MIKSISDSIHIPSSALVVRAPAKVNLVLRILDRRADGFHNLWSLMQTVELEDEIAIRLDQNCAGIQLRCDDPSLSTDRTNLVYRAAEAVLQRCGRTIGVDIALTKRIPMGAGLGGGSSDAAATIVGLCQLLDLGWPAKEMVEVGQALGSDVPFFFFAPSAVVRGRGEQFSPVTIAGSRWVVLVNPGFSVDTKWAYQELSSSRVQVQPLSDRHLSLGSKPQLSWESLLESAENDFETPVFKAHPILQRIREDLLGQGAEVALLSGSGATIFGVFRHEAMARDAAVHFQARPQLKVFAVPVGAGPVRCLS